MDNKKIILNIVKLIFALIIGGVMGAKLLTSGSRLFEEMKPMQLLTFP